MPRSGECIDICEHGKYTPQGALSLPPFNEGIMKLEDQVVSRELSEKLKALGVNKEPVFYWIEVNKDKWECWELIHLMQHWECCHQRNEKPVAKIPAYSVAELGELLPAGISLTPYKTYYLVCHKDGHNNSWRLAYETHKGTRLTVENKEAYVLAETEADTRALLLIYLIENNLIDLKLIQ